MPLSAARSGGPTCADGRPKYEPDLWHLHGGRHNPFEIGRLTLEIAELFASVSRRAIPRTRHLNDLVWVFKTIGFERHTSGQADNPLMTGTSERYPVPLRQLGCPANG